MLGGVFAGAQAANADGAVSLATMARSRGIYGTRVADLADAVEKGDFEAVLAEKNAFVLFNNSNNRPKNKEVRSSASLSVLPTHARGRGKACLALASPRLASPGVVLA